MAVYTSKSWKCALRMMGSSLVLKVFLNGNDTRTPWRIVLF